MQFFLLSTLLPWTLLIILSTGVLTSCTAVHWLGEKSSLKFLGNESRSYGEFNQDKNIQGSIEKAFFQHQENLPLWINVAVYKKTVLLSGVAPSEEMKDAALNIAQNTPEVLSVHQGIHVLENGSAQIRKDQKNKSALQMWLLGDMRIDSRNYIVRVANGIVYLLGQAHTKQELDYVLKHCEEVSGIRGVESFVSLPKSQAPKKAS
jgi:osmotically-inducible protein OsmY